jgi:hypothetical protein
MRFKTVFLSKCVDGVETENYFYWTGKRKREKQQLLLLAQAAWHPAGDGKGKKPKKAWRLRMGGCGFPDAPPN